MKVFKEYESKILFGVFCLDIKAGGLLWQRHSYCDVNTRAAERLHRKWIV